MRLIFLAVLLVLPTVVFANEDLDRYFSNVMRDRPESISKAIEIPELEWEDIEKIYQDLRTSLDSEVDIYKLLLLDYPRLRLLRNELFAKKGYVFKSYYLGKYFKSLGYNLSKKTVALSKAEAKIYNSIRTIEYAKKVRKYYGYYFNNDFFNSIGGKGVNTEKVIEHLKDEEGNEKIKFLSTGKTIDLKKVYFDAFFEDENGKTQHNPYLGYYETYELFDDPKIVLIRGWDDEPARGPQIKEFKGAYDYDGKLLFKSDAFSEEVGYSKETDSFLTYAQNGCCGVTDINASVVKSDGKTIAQYKSACGYANFVKPVNSEAHLLSMGSIAKSGESCEMGTNEDFGRLVFFDRNGLVLDQEFEGQLISLYPSDTEDKAKVALIDEDLVYFSNKQYGEFIVKLSMPVPFIESPVARYPDIPEYGTSPSDKLVPIENPTIMWMYDLVGKCSNQNMIVDQFKGDSVTDKSSYALDLCFEKILKSSNVPWDEMKFDCYSHGCSMGFPSEYIDSNKSNTNVDYAIDYTYRDLEKLFGKMIRIKQVSDQSFLLYGLNSSVVAAFGDKMLYDFIKRGVYP